jgi:type I restriction enzyme R subunit
MRYTDQRESTHEAGLQEGEPRLFHTNQFLIRTCGEQAQGDCAMLGNLV